MRVYPTRDIFEADFPNVVGTAFGDGETLVVLVTKKVAEEDLDVDDIVPTSVVIDGEAYVTDVHPVGVPHGQDTSMSETEPADHQSRHRPIVGGTSIGNESVGAGTIGSPLLEHDESGDPVVLTNSHVTGGAEQHFQPASMDGGAEQEPFGTLREESPLDPSTDQRTDSALINVDPETVDSRILGIGELVAFGGAEDVGFSTTFKKAGRTTGVTSGSLRGTDASVRVAYGSETIRFRGVDVFTHMSEPGDSGSLIGYMSGNGFVATHLMFAGSDQATIAIPLETVQEYHGALSLPGSADEDGGDNGGDTEKDMSFGEFHHQCYISPAVGVVDGDTIDIEEIALGLDVTKINQRIRLLGVDTAEMNSPDEDERHLAEEQRLFVQDWLQEGLENYDGWYPYLLETHKDEYDAFGRLLTHVVRRSDGESLADAILEEYGDEYRYDVREQLANLSR